MECATIWVCLRRPMIGSRFFNPIWNVSVVLCSSQDITAKRTHLSVPHQWCDLDHLIMKQPGHPYGGCCIPFNWKAMAEREASIPALLLLPLDFALYDSFFNSYHDEWLKFPICSSCSCVLRALSRLLKHLYIVYLFLVSMSYGFSSLRWLWSRVTLNLCWCSHCSRLDHSLEP